MVQAVLRRLQNRITERNAFLPFTEHYFRRDTIQIPGKKLLRHGNAGGKAVMHGRFCCKCFFLPCNCFHRFGKLLQLFCILRQFMIINGKLCQRLMQLSDIRSRKLCISFFVTIRDDPFFKFPYRLIRKLIRILRMGNGHNPIRRGCECLLCLRQILNRTVKQILTQFIHAAIT